MRFDIVGIGELLVDMTATFEFDGIKYLPNSGGAPANFLAMTEILGANTAFVGKVGDDYFGHKLVGTLEEIGIDTSFVLKDGKYPTTLAFVHLDSGESSFSFYRNQTADVMLDESEIDYSILDETKAIYFGSLAFTTNPIKNAVDKFIFLAKEKKVLVFFDPNYRPSLWKNKHEAIKEIMTRLEFADILKLSEEELFLITESEDYKTALEEFDKYDISLILVTRGSNSTIYKYKDEVGEIATYKANMLDSTGAGDAFFGSVAQQILCADKDICDFSMDEIKDIIDVANLIASICIENYGGIPSLPNKEVVLRRLRMLQKYGVFS
jgi:fructokinase